MLASCKCCSVGGFFSGSSNSNNLMIKQPIFLMGVLEHPPPGTPLNYTCQFELHFWLRHIQKEGESFDDLAGALIRQGNRALLHLEPKARSEIIRDQFIEGVRDSYIQERLFQDGPSTLEEVLKTAHKLGAAWSAQQSLRTTTVRTVNAVSVLICSKK